MIYVNEFFANLDDWSDEDSGTTPGESSIDAVTFSGRSVLKLDGVAVDNPTLSNVAEIHQELGAGVLPVNYQVELIVRHDSIGGTTEAFSFYVYNGKYRLFLDIRSYGTYLYNEGASNQIFKGNVGVSIWHIWKIILLDGMFTVRFNNNIIFGEIIADRDNINSGRIILRQRSEGISTIRKSFVDSLKIEDVETATKPVPYFFPEKAASN